MRSIQTTRQEKLCMMMRLARKKAGLTQAQLEKRLRAYQGYVSKYETGERALTVTELIDIAEVLDIDPPSIVKAVMRE